jgi:hypothetical protein
MDRPYADVKVSIKQADGMVAIMSFITLGRGDSLPRGAEWADKAAGIWMREPTPANIEHELDRIPTFVRPLAWRIVKAEDVPTDRTYRNALRDDGAKLAHDVEVAKGLHREQLRHARAARFTELDGQWMAATGQGKKAEADAVEAERQRLRDLPDDPAIDAAKTIEELKATWPADLSR